MSVYITTNFLGTFAFDEKGKLIAKELFPKDPAKISERVVRIKNGEIVEEEQTLLKRLKKLKVEEISWDKKIQVKGLRCVYKKDNPGVEFLRKNFRKFSLDFKWVSTQAELNSVMTKVNILLAGEELKKPKKDRIIIHVIGVIDELDSTLNNLSERLREWYGLYFPELGRRVKSHEKYSEIVGKYGEREKIKDRNLVKLASGSVGMAFSEEDLESVQRFSKMLLELYKTRQSLSEYLEKTTREVIPNLSQVGGPLLASRLLSLAGGLERMAKMPSSKVQLLGAEKALFRHLRGEGKAPKYGILFGHPLVQKAPKHLKGKIARLVASKLSLAAKIDMFSGEDRSVNLLKDLEEKVKKTIGA